jgi:ferredoxin--NADP+ reductase
MPATADKYEWVEILSRKDYADDLWSIRVRPDQKLLFKPGQYATLGVESEGRVIERAYSIVSSPLEDEIEFFFELVPQGQLTPLLYRLQPGQNILMRRQAKGLFTLDVKSGHKNHFLVSTVTGVAPYVSMARTFAREEGAGKPFEHQLFALQAGSRSWELAYEEELAAATTHPWFHYVPTISRPWEDAKWNKETGRIEDVLRKYLDSWGLSPDDTTGYLCGHPAMIENSKGILQRRGFAKQSIREEIYWIPKKEA